MKPNPAHPIARRAGQALALTLAALSFVSCRTVGVETRQERMALDGGAIAYSDAGRGDPMLVLVHCWSCDRHLWDGQIGALARRYRVIALDLPGHGRSPAAAAGRRTIAALGADVAALVERLRPRRVVLVGSSLGAAVALDAAARLDRRVLGVVLVDAVQNADFVLPADVWQRLIGDLEADYGGACSGFVSSLFAKGAAPELIAARIADMCDADPAVALPLLRDLGAQSEAAMLRAAGAPVRGINGDQYPTDEAANRKYADYRAAVIPGSGHFPMLEQPAAFLAALERWIAELTGAP
jgi:pimeloyl-ACP methyl ester carboxylesterase